MRRHHHHRSPLSLPRSNAPGLLAVLALGAVALASVLAACQVQTMDSGASALPPPLVVVEDATPQYFQYTQVEGITFPHETHVEAGLECGDCHGEPSETQPDTVMPDPDDLCTMCHDDASLADNPDLAAYFEAVRGASPDQRWPLPYELSDEVIFTHDRHLTAELACEDCHTNIPAGGPPQGFSMETCEGCHTYVGYIGEGCASCHEEIRPDVPAPSHDATWGQNHALAVYEDAPAWETGQLGDCGLCHTVDSCASCHTVNKPSTHDQDWRRGHGAEAPEAWADGALGECATCHQPAECSTCHRMTEPESHAVSGTWRTRHGQSYYAALDLDRAQCAMCHRANDCQSCHVDTPPRDHTPFFKVDGHGLSAEMDRDRCATCHRQDVCTQCHFNTRPRDHRPGWGSPTDGHCMSCHAPYDYTQCTTCHRGNPGHANTPSRPLDPRHQSAATDCRACHFGSTSQPHPDNGDDCLFCH